MRLRNEQGGVKPYLCILILVVSVYLGYKFVPPYYRYFALESEAKSIARLSYSNPERYRRLLYETARDLKVPIQPSDIRVIVSKRRVMISTSWSETVDLLGYRKITLRFKVSVEE